MRSAVIPSQASLRDASSPEGGSFIRADRKMPKSSPFGGAGCDHREQTERVQPAESLQKPYPQRRAFAESGAANAVCRYTTPPEKMRLERPAGRDKREI